MFLFLERSHYLVLVSWYEEDFQVVMDTYKWLVPQVIIWQVHDLICYRLEVLSQVIVCHVEYSRVCYLLVYSISTFKLRGTGCLDHYFMPVCRLSLQRLHLKYGEVCTLTKAQFAGWPKMHTDFRNSAAYLNSINPIRLFHMALGSVSLNLNVSITNNTLVPFPNKDSNFVCCW